MRIQRAARRATVFYCTCIIAFALSAAGCNRKHEWKPRQVATIKGVPTTQVTAAINARLQAAPPDGISTDHWKHVTSLYASYNGTPLWMDKNGFDDVRSRQLLAAVADASTDALRLDGYDLGDIVQAVATVRRTAKPSADQLAMADVLLSAAYFSLAEDLLSGQVDPRSLSQDWHIDARHERVDSAVFQSLREPRLDSAILAMRPTDPQYDSLRAALETFRGIVAKGGWTPVPAGKQLKKGDHESPERLAALRARLVAEGIQVAPSPASDVFDDALASAVADFQSHHGIGVDSALGQETLDALNVPANYRLQQIAANLERYRWLPRALPQRYVWVNVPEFRLEAFDSGKKTLEMKVIVGEEYEGKRTPVFSDSMETVVFRPYWMITPDIQKKEIEPKVAADPSYLDKNDMEYFDDHGQQRIRQRPGGKNSLGLVKFLFPNDYNIYLHDTPEDQLFDKDVRAFSHGCIRLEKPEQFAQWVLGWPLEKVQEQEHGKDDHGVPVRPRIPVYITYFTTYVRDGQLYFGNDLYSRDDALVQTVGAGAYPEAKSLEAVAALRKLVKD